MPTEFNDQNGKLGIPEVKSGDHGSGVNVNGLPAEGRSSWEIDHAMQHAT